MNPRIRAARENDASEISKMVHASFRAHIASDWEMEARETFLGETSSDRLAAAISAATFAAVYEEQGHIVGVILLPRPNLVQLCFVAATHLRRGIGSALWEAARTHLEIHVPEVKTVELNSSPYAVSAYRAMGFFPISETFRRRGTVATRMACWLPGRDSEKAPNAI